MNRMGLGYFTVIFSIGFFISFFSKGLQGEEPGPSHYITGLGALVCLLLWIATPSEKTREKDQKLKSLEEDIEELNHKIDMHLSSAHLDDGEQMGKWFNKLQDLEDEYNRVKKS